MLKSIPSSYNDAYISEEVTIAITDARKHATARTAGETG